MRQLDALRQLFLFSLVFLAWQSVTLLIPLTALALTVTQAALTPTVTQAALVLTVTQVALTQVALTVTQVALTLTVTQVALTLTVTQVALTLTVTQAALTRSYIVTDDITDALFLWRSCLVSSTDFCVCGVLPLASSALLGCRCLCRPGFGGISCDTAYNTCHPGPKCQNGGTCIDDGGTTYTCMCPAWASGTQL